MTEINKDYLLELCKPYLLDLVLALAKSLKYPDEPMQELLEGETHQLGSDLFLKIHSFSKELKLKLLYDITFWIHSSSDNQKPVTND